MVVYLFLTSKHEKRHESAFNKGSSLYVPEDRHSLPFLVQWSIDLGLTWIKLAYEAESEVVGPNIPLLRV